MFILKFLCMFVLLHYSSVSYTREGETLYPFPLTSLTEDFLVLGTSIYHKLPFSVIIRKTLKDEK